MRRSQIRRHRGFSLVEIAMVLAVGTLIISGAMLFFQRANMSLIANDMQTEFTVIVSAVHNITSGVSDYSGVTDAVMYGSPDIPAKWKSPVFNSLMTPYHMPLSMVIIGNSTLFIKSSAGNPALLCSRLVSSDPGPGAWWTVGGAVPVYSAAVGKAMTPAETNVACGYPIGSSADLAYGIN